MKAAVEQKILEKLDFLSQEIGEIKEHMVDVDVILSEEDRRLLDESVRNEKEGKLISLEELEHVRNKSR